MKWGPYCLGLCGLGILLLIAGQLWHNMLGDRLAWTEEQALKFNEVSATFHQVAHARVHHDHGSHGHAGHVHLASSHAHSTSESELAAAKNAWQEQMQQRDAAIAWRDFWNKLLSRGGLGAIAIGGLGYLAIKNVMEDQD